MRETGWKVKLRRVNGKRKYVKVRRHPDGREQVRVLGHRNLTDAEVRPALRKRRVKGYINFTDQDKPSNRWV